MLTSAPSAANRRHRHQSRAKLWNGLQVCGSDSRLDNAEKAVGAIETRGDSNVGYRERLMEGDLVVSKSAVNLK